ncbi:hypothetical protein SAM40697_0496 [Streptomyces ambofaciens]|uniref:Uncharacterized protein n=1 Tax=Streptomyces ambofaciens TaxID=1889 RepID=A0ABM6ATE4_STRAM|nr:hypothetical protein SAM40697_0496 [Streptomyces ambofaciens]
MPTEPVPHEPVALPAQPKPAIAPTRRTFIATGTAVGTAVVAGTVLGTDLLSESEAAAAPAAPVGRLTVTVNGTRHTVTVDNRLDPVDTIAEAWARVIEVRVSTPPLLL